MRRYKKAINVAHEPISGKARKAMNASLKRDSVLVLISAASIIMKKIKPAAKNGNGQ
jgi:hypothetical protein